jgi:hypothetical protein
MELAMNRTIRSPDPGGEAAPCSGGMTTRGRWLCLSLVAAVCGLAACSDATGPELFPDCFITAPHTFGGHTSGSLAAGACVLTTGDLPGRRYVNYYSLRLGSEAQVTIDLESTQFDSYLYLWVDGTGERLARDDDSGIGSDARVSTVLPAGDYVIGVTSYAPEALGAFDLYTYATPTHFQGCAITGTHTFGSAENATITLDACRVRPGAANIWEEVLGDVRFLRLNRNRNVRIDMEAAFDSFLLVMDAGTGAMVIFDDDSGTGYNARITTFLYAGSYMIVATSYGGQRTGAYQLSTAPW